MDFFPLDNFFTFFPALPGFLSVRECPRLRLFTPPMLEPETELFPPTFRLMILLSPERAEVFLGLSVLR